jgi:hypothetical protein
MKYYLKVKFKMLTPIESKKIWDKLVKQNYPIEKITICADDFSYIEIVFENMHDLEKFRQLIFDFMYLDFSQTCNSNQLTLFVNVDLDFFSKLTYPEYTKELNVFNVLSSKNIINLGILPSKLNKLLIISSEPFDLTNLPNMLTILDLSGCTGCKKFNLDYLPSSLEILKLASTDDLGGASIYGLKDFENLPISLNEILIGNMFFNSTQELLEKYEEKKPFIRKS